ncbi:MAG: heat-inducible transcription repressor HrcA [Acidobacteria bacterium]|nr:MAG: heat-inducible transcription repressor HrcA [Acidobacteriota bacterium]
MADPAGEGPRRLSGSAGRRRVDPRRGRSYNSPQARQLRRGRDLRGPGRAGGEAAVRERIELDQRSKDSLEIIIQQHVRTGEPVSSRAVARLHPERLSPATIRALMADLTEMGLLAQPHTSAGRVPTDRGYRYFVDEILSRKQRLPRREVRRIERLLLSAREIEELLARAGKLLGELTGEVGVVLAPDLEQAVVEHVEFVRISARRFVAVIVSRPGVVLHRVLDSDVDLSQRQLDRLSAWLREQFSGLTLPEVRRRLLQALERDREWIETIGRPSFMALSELIERAMREGNELILEGTSHLLSKPEFSDIDRLREVLETFEERARLLRLLDSCLSSQGVRVIIGSEADDPGLAPISVVASPYRAGRAMRGLVGVLGPRRMEYARAVALVDHFARTMSRALSGEESREDQEEE